ncbi:thioredoxin [uncultured Caudovirales phage]|uniref:Thioredoxin n=1 Tax=uncultured Caudovirales phage TaxID=2100421 RepID=A0A6J7WWV3_9CAUD|nr:thioredoxin [uncultured Caudovirales phage]
MKAIKFYAEWCGPCKGLSMIIEGAKDKITVPIDNVDIDQNIMDSVQYGVRSVPTMILLDENGAEIKRKVGTMNEAQLLEFLKV